MPQKVQSGSAERQEEPGKYSRMNTQSTAEGVACTEPNKQSLHRATDAITRKWRCVRHW